MKLFAFATLMFATIACAQKKYLDRDVNNPAYHEGTGFALNDQTSLGGINKSPNIAPPAYSSNDAVAGLIESGISLAAYPDYYKASTIGGICVVGDMDLSQVPCRHLQIELLDEAEKIVGTTNCNDAGQFAFYVKKNKSYLLRLTDSRYAIESREARVTHKMGANVIIHAVTAH